MDLVVADREKYLLLGSLFALMLQFLKDRGLTDDWCKATEDHLGKDFTNGPLASFVSDLYLDLDDAINNLNHKEFTAN